jgi:hypothetical protein
MLAASMYTPTASQELEEAQDTAVRELPLVPLLGLGTIDQAVPFQASTRVRVSLGLAGSW